VSAKTRENVHEIFYEIVREKRRLDRKHRREEIRKCGRRRMCGVLTAGMIVIILFMIKCLAPTDPCALPKIPSDSDYDLIVGSADGCCHSIVAER
jgi:hypothetical protein